MTRRRKAAMAPVVVPAQRQVPPADPESTGTVGSAGRNRYVDLVRLVAILVVMGGHWLATIVVVGDGQPRGRSALAEFGYMRWLTLLGRWAGWTHARFVRPT